MPEIRPEEVAMILKSHEANLNLDCGINIKNISHFSPHHPFDADAGTAQQSYSG